MNISLPAPLKSFVDERATEGGYGSGSEYVRELIRRDRDRVRLRDLMLEGAVSEVEGEADDTYFSGLRRQLRRRRALHRLA